MTVSYPSIERDDEVVGVRGAGRRLNLRLRRGRPPEGDVGGDRVVEQHGLLRDHARSAIAARPASRRARRSRRW